MHEGPEEANDTLAGAQEAVLKSRAPTPKELIQALWLPINHRSASARRPLLGSGNQ